MVRGAAHTLFAVLGGLFLVAWVVQLAAASHYSAWVAARVPDSGLQASALRCRWLLPLIAVVGVPLLMIGPLAALVRYWNLLHTVRQRVRDVA